MCFYILKKLQPNISKDPDERYNTQIMKLVPHRPKPTSDADPSFFTGLWLFINDFVGSMYRTFKSRQSHIVIEDVLRIQNNDHEIK